MPDYPYLCSSCSTEWEVTKSAADCRRPEPCPSCGLETADQDYGAKSIGGFVSREGAWSEGKTVVQLHPRHPDRMVTSKTQMEGVYRKHGISMDTGHFESKEAQVEATVPRSQHVSPSVDTSDTVCGGIKGSD